MATIASDSSHFARSDLVPTIAVQATVRAAFALMHAEEAGGIVALDQEEPIYYLTGRFLQAGVLFVAEQMGLASAALIPVGGYLTRFLNGNDKMASKVRGSVPEEFLPVRIQPTRVAGSDDAEPWFVPQMLVLSVQVRGKATGWFFNHETLRATRDTPPPDWRCKNKHSNPDMDSGFCRRCGEPILTSAVV